jgi:hypothetical protein
MKIRRYTTKEDLHDELEKLENQKPVNRTEKRSIAQKLRLIKKRLAKYDPKTLAQ